MESIDYIPEKYEDGFIALSSIDSDRFETIIKSLSKIPLTSTIIRLANKVAEDAQIDIIEVQDIFLTIDSLIGLLDKKVSKEDIIEQVTKVISETELITFSETNNEKEFKSRFSLLLSNEKIYYASKADELITDNGVVFLDSKIVTDIRPIFDIVLEDSPKVGLITHTLQIHYRTCENSNHQNIYFSLDSLDIAKLKEVLERAIIKENSLTKLLEKTGIESITI